MSAIWYNVTFCDRKISGLSKDEVGADLKAMTQTHLEELSKTTTTSKPVN
jgi:hypothetical protein